MKRAGILVALSALVCAAAGTPLGERSSEGKIEIVSRAAVGEDGIVKGALCESTPGVEEVRGYCE